MSHLEQVQRAIDFIEGHLHDDVSVDAIAKEAAISRWHFQLIFSATVGETVKSYVRRRRLSVARVALQSSDKRIIDIAIEAGFESQESFSRAFKAEFDLTPAECHRTDPKQLNLLRKPKITMEYLNHLYGGTNMEPKIIELKSFEIVGLGTKFISILSPEKNNHILIPQLWDHFFGRYKEIQNRTDQNFWGVCTLLDKREKSHPDECFYISGVEVSKAGTLPAGMKKITVPSGKYAVFTHKGSLSKLDHTMNYIYGAWIHRSGNKLREAPDLEFYDDRFKPDSNESEFDIYIPIV